VKESEKALSIQDSMNLTRPSAATESDSKFKIQDSKRISVEFGILNLEFGFPKMRARRSDPTEEDTKALFDGKLHPS
jgi:hypothetical protein